MSVVQVSLCNEGRQTACVRGRGALTSYQMYLPPANEVCEGYVFTGVCLSTGWRHACRGGHVWQGVCVWWGGMHGRGCAWHGSMHGTGGGMHGRVCGMPPPPSRYYEIRSMIGRYASYWNAFLSHIYFMFYLTSRLYNLFTRFGSQMKRCLVLNFFFF